MKSIEQAKSDLRSCLALEIKEALKAQDAQLGVLIGKLQVGQARRKNIIKKQDKAIKELQVRSYTNVMGSSYMQMSCLLELSVWRNKSKKANRGKIKKIFFLKLKYQKKNYYILAHVILIHVSWAKELWDKAEQMALFRWTFCICSNAVTK